MTSPSWPTARALPDAIELPPVTGEALALGAGVVLAGWALGRVMGWLTRRVLRWRGRSPSASEMFGSLAQAVTMVLAVAAALTLVFPSVKPVNALGGIGVLSIAAGIAFQTVLGNMFAGIVILARDIFRVGDQIAVDEVAGTVTEISLTSTVVRTFDGRMALIPNSVIHSQVVTVQTGYEQVRSTISLDIDDRADLGLAVSAAEDAMLSVPVVLHDPAPQALLQGVGTATVRMDLRFWSGARQMETRVAQHEVIVAVLRALADASVVTGSDVVVIEGGPALLEALRPDGTDQP
ncbi:mechanosensitive ion channel family protein [Nocardioides sp.]|uniref:mechanosensitive ion channel family protein n=1 Tax=Nocardioides sp. TaxID=35761 RepID=UPI002734FAD0|nr:mechanosensitive ion channel family protein [Nocardioides sp.]MDP3893072.1 mechanosensitive ion channel family protein [Nocardioides sp.]